MYPNTVCDATLEGTRRVAKAFNLRLQGPVQEALILDERWATREELDEIYVSVRAWADRPDAMFLLLFRGALAWAPK